MWPGGTQDSLVGGPQEAAPQQARVSPAVKAPGPPTRGGQAAGKGWEGKRSQRRQKRRAALVTSAGPAGSG